MKRLTGFVLAGIIATQALVLGSTPAEGISSYYECAPISGEESREVSYLYDGVTRTDIVLSNNSKYKKQVFTVVEFDPSQDDLYFEVRGGDETYLTTKNKTSDTMARFNAEGTGKTALVATNGGLWMSKNYQVRELGQEANYVYPEYPANVKKGYNIPWGYNMYDGEIVCTNNIEEETPFPNYFRQFGITEDGEVVFGCVKSNITVTNNTTGKSVISEGINRLPVENALITYTDRGMASNYCLDDAYEVTIDFDFDYTIKPGCTIKGTVTAISPPGSERSAMTSNRIILTARGDRLDDLANYAVGHSITINVEVEDTLDPDNTEKWYSVSNCVNGHQWVIWDGVSQGNESTTYYPATILGVKEDGNAVMITSYGRQYNSLGGYYSYGLQIGQVDELCRELGIVTAFLMDGGGSATMWCVEPDGSYELTGRPCDKKSDGTYGAERIVLSSLILAVGPSKSGLDSTDVLTNNYYVDEFIREPENVAYSGNGMSTAVTATGIKNPTFKYDLFNTSADTYKYMVIEGKPTNIGGGTFTLGIYPSAGQTLSPSISSSKKLTFECNGIWQKKLIDLTANSEWSGKMNYIRMDLFDDTGIGVVGEGFDLSKVRFFKTLDEANAFISGSDDQYLHGDADGNGVLDLLDVTCILKVFTKTGHISSVRADYDDDNIISLADATFILRKIAE